jgi:hypothetical protein
MSYSESSLSGSKDRKNIAAFMDWRDTPPRVSNHRFLGDCIEYFVDDTGWLAADITPMGATERYWLSRDAISRVGDWPRPIIACYGVVMSPEPPDQFITLVTEIANFEEVFRFRPLTNVCASNDLGATIVPFLENMVGFPEE